MRRFEFVQGTSAKFWMADVEDSTFVVVYGRLGTGGQRKDKAFPSPEAATRELEKKIAEKLREGYHEVAATAAAANPAPGGAKGAAAAAPKLELPPRHVVKAGVKPEAQAAAAAALDALAGQLGRRSWRVRRSAQAALKALDKVSGQVPGGALGASFTALLKKRGLPLRVVLALCGKLDVAAFVSALTAWQGGGPTSGKTAGKVLQQQADILDEPELALRVGALLCDRPEDGGSELSWARRWQVLRPHLEGYLIGKGSNLRGFLEQLDTSGDPVLAARVKRMGRAR